LFTCPPKPAPFCGMHLRIWLPRLWHPTTKRASSLRNVKRELTCDWLSTSTRTSARRLSRAPDAWC
jgi:hypothetical protein